MPKCITCKYYAENKSAANVRITKGTMKPHKGYCIHGKMKEIAYRSLGVYGYPVWCSFNLCQNTCMACGTRIRAEEGDYCSRCR